MHSILCALLLAAVQDDAAVYVFDLSDLPRAESGAWSEWSPQDPLPEAARGAMGAAMAAYQGRDYERASRLLRALLEQQPDFPPALYQLGLSGFRLRRYGDCAAVYERFLEVVPQEVGATQALGHCYYTLGDYDRARVHYERVLAVNGDSVEALRGYGLTWMRLGNEEQAMELLLRVVELRPKHATAWLEIAQLHDDAGELEAAEKAALRGREVAPNEPRAWFLLSRIWGSQGRREEALEAREQFEQLSRAVQRVRQIEGRMLHAPTDRELLVQLALAQSSAGDARGVRSTVIRGLQLFQDDREWHLFALERAESLDDSAALHSVAQACERRFGNDAEMAERLLAIYTRLGDRAGVDRMRRRTKAGGDE